MMQPISGTRAAAEAARTADAMAAILENAQAQTGRLNGKLLKAGVTEKVQDPALGGRIDVGA